MMFIRNKSCDMSIVFTLRRLYLPMEKYKNAYYFRIVFMEKSTRLRKDTASSAGGKSPQGLLARAPPHRGNKNKQEKTVY